MASGAFLKCAFYVSRKVLGSFNRRKVPNADVTSDFVKFIEGSFEFENGIRIIGERFGLLDIILPSSVILITKMVGLLQCRQTQNAS